ncbi:ABC transporter ATP-binding protein [Pseudoruegeria sp. HB172150]|uniref:ABC transporter ATP-binding protein n=1 Tax=Pseudoruegeria sp. HB172150 TaxID=2721164 RepID=UPI00155319BD|nr:ABC transporter ATP-binding protein [Pseudoruegeria sp. HB172150]
MSLLTVDKLEVVYQRAITAIQGVSLRVEERQIVALLGTNGAGKTTTLRAISGFLGLDDARVTEGSIRFRDTQLENRPPYEITRRGLALVPERDKVFPNLTVAENLAVVPSRTSGTARKMEERAYHFFPRLTDLRRRTAGLLSGGERQMLAIAAGIMCDPDLLLVDELSLGLSPVAVEELTKSLVAIRDELGVSILLVEQSATVALGIADYGYVLENGRIVLDGDAQRLRDHSDVQEFYLGHTGSDRRSYRDVKQYRRSRRWYG